MRNKVMFSLPLIILMVSLVPVIKSVTSSDRLVNTTDSCDHYGFCESFVSGATPLAPGVLYLPYSYNRNLQPPGRPCRVLIGFMIKDVMEVNDDDYTVSIKVNYYS